MGMSQRSLREPSDGHHHGDDYGRDHGGDYDDALVGCLERDCLE